MIATFTRVPRDNWRRYPTEWDHRDDRTYDRSRDRDYDRDRDNDRSRDRDYDRDRDYRSRDHSSTTFQVTFGNRRPRWSTIPGTRVMMVRQGQRPDYDIFRYGGYYYTCHDGYWYRARGHRGHFRAIDVRHVPRRVFSIPERHWKRHWKNSHYARYDRDDHRDNRGRSKRRGHPNHD